MNRRELIEAGIVAGQDNDQIRTTVELASYQDVPAVSVAQWLGENALREKVDQFLDQPIANTSPVYATVLALRAGLKQLLVMQANPEAKLGIAPGSGNRLLLQAALALGVMDQNDLAGILSRARPGFVEPSDDEIDGIRSELVEREAVAERRSAGESMIASIESWIVNGGERPQWSV